MDERRWTCHGPLVLSKHDIEIVVERRWTYHGPLVLSKHVYLSKEQEKK